MILIYAFFKPKQTKPTQTKFKFKPKCLSQMQMNRLFTFIFFVLTVFVN